MMLILFALLFWLACGAFAYALALGYFTSRYPWMRHTNLLPIALFCGTSALLIELAFLGVNNLRWRALSTVDRYHAFQQAFPGLPMTFEQYVREFGSYWERQDLQRKIARHT